jgi:hypothetical protein
VAQDLTNPERAVLPWRIVAGILLHFCVPAYLLACLAACVLETPLPGSVIDVLGRMVQTGVYFIPAYTALIGVSAMGARLIDPLLRRRRRSRLARDPQAIAEQSRARLAGAMTTLRQLPGGARLIAALATLDHLPWDHADARAQDLSRDLATAAAAFASAFRSSPEERRGEVIDLAAASSERIAAAVGALAEERGKLDQGDAQTIAGYIAARYADDAPLTIAPTARRPHS